MMDFLAMVEYRLSFIERFYNRTADPFEVIQRKIAEGEEPFIPKRAPDEYDEPEYLDEWQEADDILRVLGHSALGLVGKALQDYLRGFIMREAEVSDEKDFSRVMKECKGDGWFQKYCFFLEQKTRFDWSRSPVPFDQIEQINLTRNDLTHDPGIDSVRAHRKEEHFRKYPVPFFADESELLMLAGEDEPAILIKVTRQNLADAIENVRRFCSFVESERTK